MKSSYPKIFQSTIEKIVHFTQRQPAAILLKGDWGIGKTYAWHNFIFPELKKKTDRIVYLSLFGVDSIDQIKRRLVTKIIVEDALKKKSFSFIKKKLNSIFAYSSGKLFKTLKINDILDFEFDLSELIPKNTLVCFDDLERKNDALDIKSFLGLVNSLTEFSKAKVIVIANENILISEKDAYAKYKEKVFLFSLEWPSAIDELFEGFISSSLCEKNREKILNSKNLILDLFHKSELRNLRALQRVICLLDYLFSFEELKLSEENIAFVVALILEENINGSLNKNANIYNGYKFFIFERLDSKSEEEMNEEEKLGLSFYKKYFGGGLNCGYSFYLYQYIALGILDHKKLKDELNPPHKYEKATLLIEELNSNWYFFTTEKIEEKIIEIESLIKSDHKISVTQILDLAFLLHLLSTHIDKDTPNLNEDFFKKINDTIREKHESSDEFDNFGPFSSEKEKSIKSPLIEYYKKEVEKRLVENLRQSVLKNIENGNLGVLLKKLDSTYSEEQLYMLATCKEVANKLGDELLTKPDLHYKFYTVLINKIINSPNRDCLTTIREALKQQEIKTTDKSAQKRLQWLLKRISEATET